MIKYIIPKRHK